MSTKQGGWNFASTGENQSLLTAFRADSTMVEMIPNFDHDKKIVLHSSTAGGARDGAAAVVGPFQANVPTQVPLWLALHLQTKSFCRVAPPRWLNSQNLSEILHYEKTHETLWSDKNNNNNNNNGEDASSSSWSSTRLPANYYEVAMRLAPLLQQQQQQHGGGIGVGTSDNSNGNDNGASVKLVVNDLLQVRLDKLRKQFSSLRQDSSQDAAAAGKIDESLQIERELQMLPTEAGLRHFVMRLSTQDNLATWQKLPPLFGAMKLQRRNALVDVLAKSDDRAGAPDKKVIRELAESIAKLHGRGIKVVLVSSGARARRC